MNNKLVKITLITKLDCTPCKGAKFILHRLKTKYNLQILLININANNKNKIYEEYNLDNTKIPSVFLDETMIGYGKIREAEIREKIEENLLV